MVRKFGAGREFCVKWWESGAKCGESVYVCVDCGSLGQVRKCGESGHVCDERGRWGSVGKVGMHLSYRRVWVRLESVGQVEKSVLGGKVSGMSVT